MKNIFKTLCLLLALVLVTGLGACKKSVFVPETPVNPEAPDDPGIYEPGFYVTVKGAGRFTGEDWDNAMSAENLKELLLADVNGDFPADKAARINGKIIHLEQGIYPFGTAAVKLPIISGKNASFTVTLKGGYKNGGYTQYPDKYHTYLSGASDYRIFRVKENAKVILNGVGLTGASGQGGGQAAVEVASGGELILEHCDVCNNYNSATTGGVQVGDGGIFRATNCRFFNNVAAHAGGVNVDGSGECYLTDCEFSNNSANGQGGALKVTTGTMKVKNCVFRNNHAETRGGAMWVSGSLNASSVSFENCLFEGNSCTSGGGVCWHDFASKKVSTVTFQDCEFVDNFASNGSAGSLYASEGNDGCGLTDAVNKIIVRNCRFSGNNSVTYNGGSLYARGNAMGNGTIQCTSCTFEGEHTTVQGAVITLGGSGSPKASFDKCVFRDCYAGTNCASFYNSATNGRLYYNACIFENNYCDKTYGMEGATGAANCFVGMNNCSVAGARINRVGATSQQAAWYNLGPGKVLFANSSIIGVPVAGEEEVPAFGLVRLNHNSANSGFINNIIVSTASNGCGIYGGDTQTSLTVTGSYNKMSPVRTQKEGTFTYTKGAGDDLTAYASSFPGLAWGEDGWAWNGGYSGSASLGATATINTAIKTFDIDFHAWLSSIGALGKDIRGNDRGTTSWPGSYQN